jgi:hypothetical protein
MAVQRRVNWLSQQRVDTPDMRAVESAASNDFDQLFQALITGPSNSYVIRGFRISMAGAIGGAASGLQMLVDPGAVLHTQSSQSGTFYLVPSGTPAQQLNSATNTIVDGAFAPSAVNYVGVEYERFVDDTTSSQVYLWNPTTNNETTKNAPRATILRYRIKISTSTPASTVLPICTILTDSGNNVISISDARPLLGRLGTGGWSADPFHTFSWADGRTENPSQSSSNSIDPFSGGDKAIQNLKEWMDAVMTSIKEVKGTTYWYSQSSSGSLESLREDLGNTIITGRGTVSHSEFTPGLMNWSDDINIRVIGSRLTYTLLANPGSTDISLADDEAAYITLVRGVTILPNLIYTNSSAVVTSVGNVAWTGPLQAGDWIKVGAENDSGYYEILTVDSSSQVTLVETFQGASTGAAGTKSKYAFGAYETSATPSTTRHIYVANRKDVPQGEDVFWLFLRSDNGGSTARVYVRFLGAEIEQGEEEHVSDNVPLNVLEYMGSPSESATKPQYVSALTPGSVPEITDITFPAATSVVNNSYFLISSSSDARKYYVWANKDGLGTDPEVPGYIGLEVAVTTGDSAEIVALTYISALNGASADDFDAVIKSPSSAGVIRVTNSSAGTASDTIDFNSGFTIVKIQDGTGIGNTIIEDGDSLTLAIKKLDQSYGSILDALDDPNYDESDDIISDIAAGNTITLPLNSRVGNIQQKYTVGKGSVQFYINGQYQRLNVDFGEIGVPGAISQTIQLLRDLAAGDTITFRMSGLGSGAGGGGGGGVGPQGPPGIAGPGGADAIGGPVAISTKTGNYTVTTSDNVLLGNCIGGSIIFTLPPAASAIGSVFFFKKIDASLNAMTVQADGAELIDSANNLISTTQYEAFTLVTDGTQWYLL